MRDISDRLSQRSSELGQDSSRLGEAIRNAVGAPSEVVEAGIADMNNRLENLVKGECWRAAKVAGNVCRGFFCFRHVCCWRLWVADSQHCVATHGSAVGAERQTILQ